MCRSRLSSVEFLAAHGPFLPGRDSQAFSQHCRRQGVVIPCSLRQVCLFLGFYISQLEWKHSKMYSDAKSNYVTVTGIRDFLCFNNFHICILLCFIICYIWKYLLIWKAERYSEKHSWDGCHMLLYGQVGSWVSLKVGRISVTWTISCYFSGSMSVGGWTQKWARTQTLVLWYEMQAS